MFDISMPGHQLTHLAHDFHPGKSCLLPCFPSSFPFSLFFRYTIVFVYFLFICSVALLMVWVQTESYIVFATAPLSLSSCCDIAIKKMHKSTFFKIQLFYFQRVQDAANLPQCGADQLFLMHHTFMLILKQ